ncbi:MAG: DUF2470 domain-containing protein, partial [Gammaproteobacteria bacterium]
TWPGLGVQARVDDRSWRLGNASFAGPAPKASPPGGAPDSADPADAADPQAGPRLTCIAEAHALSADATGAVAERYYRFFPAARAYAGTHDFSFYALRPVRLRYIGGFGKIGWIEPHEINLSNPLADAEAGIVEHMNGDHADALRAYCRHFFAHDAQQATLVGADADGVDLLADGVALRLPFAARAEGVDALRQQLIELLRLAREAAGGA